MGRAYEVRKASIQKTGAARGKIYSMYAKEIYAAAKSGGVDLASNYNLKRLIERARSEEVPNDIINRAIDKVNSGIDENLTTARYELFGPGNSTLIVDCLTDNVNRTVSAIRTVINKCHSKIGSMGSVAYLYDNLGIISYKGLSEDETLELLLDNDIDVSSVETIDDITVVYVNPTDLHAASQVLKEKNLEFIKEDIEMLPQTTVTLEGEDKEVFDRLITMLDEVEDVSKIYHNVRN